MAEVNETELARRFTHHPPRTPEDVAQHEAVREAGRVFADMLNRVLPEGREKSLAFTHVETAVFWSNASLARARD